ncbi:MAG: sensor histidine kinase [Porticoccaceae bacterium]
MHEIAVSILLLLSTTLGIVTAPEAPSEWQVIKDWEENNEGYVVYTAKNNNIINICNRNPASYIDFPLTVHSSAKLIIDGQVIAITNPSDFKYVKSFYGTLIVPCSQLYGATGSLEWHVISYTRYFAWFKYFPRVLENRPRTNFFNETLNIVASAISLCITVLYGVLFIKKIPRNKFIFLLLSNLFTAFYFIGTTAGLYGMNVSMLLAHKIADSGLWLGVMSFIYVLHLEKMIPKWINTTFVISIAISLILVLMAPTGDSVQLGTIIPFPLIILLSIYSFFRLLMKGKLGSSRKYIQTIALSVSLCTYLHDILVITGLINSYLMLPLGMPSSYIFILLSINNSINSTYAERDRLKIATQKTNQELQHAQDELIKSEKMAMMGRAVARIAHELNTPIYAARSAGQSIQTKTNQFTQSLEKDPYHIVDLTKQYNKDLISMANVLQISLSRAAELVRNFKEISVDQNNVRKKPFNLLEYIDTSLATLTESLRRKNITVNLQGNNITLYHDPSLFYQLINNLVSNTEKYAYPNSGGIIDIVIEELPDEICILFSDYGKGISQINQPKIFDAFFTTGGGTKGLGLGLNIVYSIVTQKLRGTISCTSQVNLGTCFSIRIPKENMMNNG